MTTTTTPGGRSIFPTIPPPPPDLLSGHRSLTPAQHYHEMVLVGTGSGAGLQHHEFLAEASTAAAASGGGFSGLEMDISGGIGGGVDGGNGRWPRQETLTLLEIRSRLDPKFKEANQKGPLWDEVSRYMVDL